MERKETERDTLRDREVFLKLNGSSEADGMTSPVRRRLPVETLGFTDDIKRSSAWSLCMGIITALLGVFLITFPLLTATITTLLLGCILILVGVARFVFALHSRSIGTFLRHLLLSALYIVAGVLIAFFPIAGVAALTVLLGSMLLVGAAVETATAFQLRSMKGWGWFLFDAAASLVVGILILAGWPASSVWAIGTLVGVAVLFNGISRIMIAGMVRSRIGAVEHDLRKAA